MCEPTTATLALTSLGLTAAGTAAQYAGAQKSKRAMDAVAAAEKLRQDKYKAESKSLFDQSLGESGADVSNQNIAAAQDKRNAATDVAVAETSDSQVGSTGGQTSRVVSDETATRTEAGRGVASIYSKNKNAINAFNDVGVNDAIRNARYLQDQSRIANFMSGSAGVVPMELEAAKGKGDNLRGIGSILSTAGSLTGMGAGMGMGAAGDAAAKAAATKSIVTPMLNGAVNVVRPNPNLLWGAGALAEPYFKLGK